MASYSPGSSPRVRGTVVQTDPAVKEERFIPAGAGNGFLLFSEAASPTVHPRGCGERSCGRIHGTEDTGSSPRVRGTAIAGAINFLLQRFIPAGAGNGL